MGRGGDLVQVRSGYVLKERYPVSEQQCLVRALPKGAPDLLKTKTQYERFDNDERLKKATLSSRFTKNIEVITVTYLLEKGNRDVDGVSREYGLERLPDMHVCDTIEIVLVPDDGEIWEAFEKDLVPFRKDPDPEQMSPIMTKGYSTTPLELWHLHFDRFLCASDDCNTESHETQLKQWKGEADYAAIRLLQGEKKVLEHGILSQAHQSLRFMMPDGSILEKRDGKPFFEAGGA